MLPQPLGANAIGWKRSCNRPSSWCLFKWLPTVLLSCGESDICFICEHRPCGWASDCERQDGRLRGVPRFPWPLCVWKMEKNEKSCLVNTNCFKVTSAYPLPSWWLLFISCRKLYLDQTVQDNSNLMVRIAKQIVFCFCSFLSFHFFFLIVSGTFSF